MTRFGLSVAAVLALSACSTSGSGDFHSMDAATLAAAKPRAACAFDSVDNVVAGDSTPVKLGKTTQLSGWVVDEQKNAPAEFTFVLGGASGAFARSAKTGVARGDVSTALGSLAAEKSGFTFTTDFSGVPAGTYPLSALVKSGAGTFVCAFKRSLVVGD